MIATPEEGPVAVLLRREVDRFIRAVGQRSYLDPANGCRRRPRYHRSWPLLVSMSDADGPQEVPAALHDASRGGVGFLCQQPLRAGARLYVKLFWNDHASYRIPAVVRHASPTAHGWLVGCAFVIDDETACEQAVSMPRPWYG